MVVFNVENGSSNLSTQSSGTGYPEHAFRRDFEKLEHCLNEPSVAYS